MSEELSKILEGLSEEQKNAFKEKGKKDAEKVVKSAAEEREKEEAKKMFKATGHWEYSDESTKLTADISEEDKKNIKIKLDEKNVIELSKSEFFNLYTLLSDVFSSVNEESDKDDIVDSIRKWQQRLQNEHYFGSFWNDLDGIFRWNGYPRKNRGRILHIK